MNTGKTTSAKLTLKMRVRNWFTRSRWIDLVTLFGFISLGLLVNWAAFHAISSDIAKLNLLSLDEWAYVDFLNWAFYGTLVPFDPWATITLYDPLGYGVIFWYLSGIVGLIPRLFGSFTVEIMAYRIFANIWLGVSMWLLYKIVYLIHGRYWPARFAGSILLMLPGFYLYDKLFSAEFLHLSLCLGTLYTFLVYLKTNQRRWCYWAALWLGLAIGVKVSALVFLPLIIIGFIWQERATQLLNAIKLLSLSAAFTILGFFLANPYVLLLGSNGANLYFITVQRNLASNASNHGFSVIGLGFDSWLQSVVIPIFFPVWFLICIGLAILIILYQQRHQARLVLIIVSAALLYTLFIMFSVKKIWAWYLFPGVALLAIIPMMIDYSWLHLRKAWQITLVCLLICSVLLWNNFSQIKSRYNELLQREHSQYFQDKQAAADQFVSWLAQQPYSDGIILKSPYIYLDQSKFTDQGLSTAIIWGNLSESYLVSYQPTLLLIEKNYGFNAPDSTVGSWSSFPAIVTERALFSSLTTSGLEFSGVRYHYTQVFETDNFIVYARD